MFAALILSCGAAFAAGFVDAIAGGGGIIVFPTLLMLNLPVSFVVGTNKLVSSCGTTVAAFTFLRSGNVTKSILRAVIPFTCVGALCGAFTVLQISNEFLKPFASILVLVLAGYLVLRPAFGGSDTFRELTPRLRRLAMLAALVLGFYDGFFGPGTGMFLSYVMVRWLGLDFVKATGNAKVLNLLSNVVPLCYFISAGNVRYDLGIPMALANICGGYLGAHSAIRSGPKLVRVICIAMSLLLAFKLAFDYFYA